MRILEDWKQEHVRKAPLAPDGLALFDTRRAWLIEGAITCLTMTPLRGDIVLRPNRMSPAGLCVHALLSIV